MEESLRVLRLEVVYIKIDNNPNTITYDQLGEIIQTRRFQGNIVKDIKILGTDPIHTYRTYIELILSNGLELNQNDPPEVKFYTLYKAKRLKQKIKPNEVYFFYRYQYERFGKFKVLFKNDDN